MVSFFTFLGNRMCRTVQYRKLRFMKIARVRHTLSYPYRSSALALLASNGLAMIPSAVDLVCSSLASILTKVANSSLSWKSHYTESQRYIFSTISTTFRQRSITVSPHFSPNTMHTVATRVLCTIDPCMSELADVCILYIDVATA
jgi:hypothetical protein